MSATPGSLKIVDDAMAGSESLIAAAVALAKRLACVQVERGLYKKKWLMVQKQSIMHSKVNVYVVPYCTQGYQCTAYLRYADIRLLSTLLFTMTFSAVHCILSDTSQRR